jgi:lysine/ornithine N-monooxygenase
MTPLHRPHLSEVLKKSIMGRKNCDVLLIGAGPKGLALHLELCSRGLASILAEKHEPGHSWRPSFLNPRTPLTPSVSHEITNHEGYRFVDFWRCQERRELKDHPMSRSLHTAEHFRHYLGWLANRLDRVHLSCGLSELRWSGTDFIATFAPGHTLRAKHVVLATGLIGVGEQDFLHDPTDLLGRSPLVQHHPGTINTIATMREFVADCKRVAIVGGGAACSSAVFQIEGHSQVPEVLIISSHSLPSKSAVRDGDLDHGHVQSQLRREFLRLIWSSSRFQVLDCARVVEVAPVGRYALDLRLQGAQHQWLERVDRVVLATGYRYDYRQIPFFRNLASSILGWPPAPRYPALDTHYRAIASNGRSLPLYFIGEAAASQEIRERWLGTTPATAQHLAASICGCSSESTPKLPLDESLKSNACEQKQREEYR